MYYVDFNSEKEGEVMVEMSFTYIHWKLAEAL